MNGILVGGVEKFSIVDFPNKIAAVVFMQGCPWRCPFCHNVALQKIGAETNFVWESFIDFLKHRQGILDAVVFSGGEPLVQDNLVAAIQEVRGLGYKIGLHTGGYRPDALAQVLPLVDWVGFDFKTVPNADKYALSVGGIKHLDNVLKSLELLLKSGKPFECRTTCDPRILSVADIYELADFLKSQGVIDYHLQRYRQVAGDETPDFECDKFFEDKNLLQYLQNSFEVFDARQ